MTLAPAQVVRENGDAEQPQSLGSVELPGKGGWHTVRAQLAAKESGFAVVCVDVCVVFVLTINAVLRSLQRNQYSNVCSSGV